MTNMKCKNCNHNIEEAVDSWKKIAKEYSKRWSGFFHKRQPHTFGSLGFGNRKTFYHLKTCHCGCNKPEPIGKGSQKG